MEKHTASTQLRKSITNRERSTSTTMEELINKLKIWRDNINSDIKHDLHDKEQQCEETRQSTTLSMAIGLLESIGTNNNIPK